MRDSHDGRQGAGGRPEAGSLLAPQSPLAARAEAQTGPGGLETPVPVKHRPRSQTARLSGPGRQTPSSFKFTPDQVSSMKGKVRWEEPGSDSHDGAPERWGDATRLPPSGSGTDAVSVRFFGS